LTKRLISIDPGYATGVSVWRVPDDEPIERVDYELIPGGIEGFIYWWNFDLPNAHTLVFEEYVPDGRDGHEIDAIEIQGLVRGTWDHSFNEIFWHRNGKKKIIGDRLLKQHGFWLNSGKLVGWTDARDVNDSQLHALAWAHANHRPSQEFFWPNTVKPLREED
jgi:hypothetical protein